MRHETERESLVHLTRIEQDSLAGDLNQQRCIHSVYSPSTLDVLILFLLVLHVLLTHIGKAYYFQGNNQSFLSQNHILLKSAD